MQMPEEIPLMPDATMTTSFEEGLRALNSGRTKEALDWFEQAIAEKETPLKVSYLIYCRAKENGSYRQAVTLCMEALNEDPKNPEIYLNLGRLHSLAGQ